MNKDQLYYFINIVDCGSINKASEKLFLSQPSLSRSIHALEKEIGKELIKRTSKGIIVTASGKALYHYAQAILDQFQMIDRLKSLPENLLYSNLSISIANIFLRDDLILEFCDKLKSVDTEINVYETTSENALNDVIQRKSELGIVIINNKQLPVFQRLCDANDIAITTLSESDLYIHANAHLYGEKVTTLNATQLLDKTYVRLPADFFSNLNAALYIDGVSINSFERTITSSNYHAIIKMIKNENAFLLGHKWQKEELMHTHIKSFLVENSETIKKYFLIINRKKESLSEAANIFIKLINKYYND